MYKKITRSTTSFREWWGKFGTVGIFALLVLILAIIKPESIFSAKSIPQILSQSSVNILLALGEFFAILLAGIDLSVGSVTGLVGMVTAKMMVAGVPVFVAVILGIMLGIMLGFINGFLVNKLQLHPFIITLGTQSIYRGITLVISNSRSVFGLPGSFSSFMEFKFFGLISVQVVIAILIAVILGFFTVKCKAARNLYALGGNKEAAWYSGINVKLHTLLAFMISGACCGIAGVVLLGRIGSAEPTAGSGYDTYAIAATIIGGTSFMGGKGKIFGVVIGGLIIGIINYGMTSLVISSNFQQIVMGALIIVSVAIDHFIGKKK